MSTTLPQCAGPCRETLYPQAQSHVVLYENGKAVWYCLPCYTAAEHVPERDPEGDLRRARNLVPATVFYAVMAGLDHAKQVGLDGCKIAAINAPGLEADSNRAYDNDSIAAFAKGPNIGNLLVDWLRAEGYGVVPDAGSTTRSGFIVVTFG